jgi:bifunctional enzyme Fae/Hps
MSHRVKSHLSYKKKYLQVALNGSLEDARYIINSLPSSDRIIVEAGTPLIKRYGEDGIRQIRDWMTKRSSFHPYIVADMKTMDRGEREVDIASSGGASAVIALGTAPIETLNSFIATCEARGLDAMIDMMNVEYPLAVLRALKKIPAVVILHRGVDEEKFNKEKMIPLHEIRRIKGAYDIMISIAGGDTVREVQRSIFNDADIVVIWKSVYQSTGETSSLIDGFLKEIK